MGDGKFDFKKSAAILVTLIGGGIVVWFLFRHFLAVVLPFFIAYLAAYLVRPCGNFLSKHTKIPYKPICILLVLIFVFGLSALVGLLFRRLFIEAMRLLTYLEDNPDLIRGLYENVRRFFSGILERILPMLSRSDAPLENSGAEAFDRMIGNMAEKLLTNITAGAATVLTSLPGILFYFIVTIIAAIYFSMDLSEINAFIRNTVPQKFRGILAVLKSGTVRTGLRYLRSYTIIFIMNVTLLTVGLLLLQRDYAFLLALIFSVVDLLPIVGIGITLIPWALYSFITGLPGLGVGLLLLYLFITLLRQFIEPRLVGAGIGLHPLLTLFAMVTGAQLFGFFGMLMGPVAAITVKSLWNARNEAENEEKTEKK